MAEETNKKVYITWKSRTWIRRDEFQYGQVVDFPPAPNQGQFLGWYTLPEGGKKLESPFRATRNDTFYAQWKGQEHTVSGLSQQAIRTVTVKDADTDEVVYTIQVPHGATVQSFPSMQKEGRVFLGWYYGNGNKLDYNSPVMTDIVVYAHWELLTYPITWNLGGHGVLGSAVLKTYTVENRGYEPPQLENEPEFKFMGWEPERIPDNAVGPITFTAKWKQEQYDITIDPNGGNIPSDFETSFQRTYGQKVYGDGLPTPTRDGYDFTGWKCGSESVSGDTAVRDDMLIQATWQIKRFTVVKYRISDESAHEEIQVDWGSKIPQSFLDPGTRNRYTFTGWFTRIDGGATVDKNTVVKSNLTIYGFWRGAVKYNVTYDANGGTFNSVTLSYDADPQTECAVIEAAERPNPTRNGYVFEGWLTQGSSTPITGSHQINSNTVLYAKWVGDEVNVRLHSNGGVLKIDNWEE